MDGGFWSRSVKAGSSVHGYGFELGCVSFNDGYVKVVGLSRWEIDWFGCTGPIGVFLLVVARYQ